MHSRSCRSGFQKIELIIQNPKLENKSFLDEVHEEYLKLGGKVTSRLRFSRIINIIVKLYEIMFYAGFKLPLFGLADIQLKRIFIDNEWVYFLSHKRYDLFKDNRMVMNRFGYYKLKFFIPPFKEEKMKEYKMFPYEIQEFNSDYRKIATTKTNWNSYYKRSNRNSS